MTKKQIIAEHIIVTFIEAGIAYAISNNIAIAGLSGAALSLIYNLIRTAFPPTSTPTS